MRIAHVRERHAPSGAPWRLVAAIGPDARTAPIPRRWLDLEVARRRLLAADPRLAHNVPLFRAPIRTLDDHLAAGLRIAALGAVVDAFTPRDGDDAFTSRDGDDAPRDGDDAVLDPADLAFGPPVLRPPSLRDFYTFEVHVGTMWRRRGGEIPEAWFRLPVFYFSNISEIRGPDEPVHAPRGSAELDFELEICALVDTPATDLEPATAEEAIGGYCILNDWSARDLQRDETAVRLGPAKGKDFATTIGPWLVTPDELADARAPGATGPSLAMTAEVTDAAGRRQPIGGGTWADAQHGFGAMLARASADVRLRPGDLFGSGTVGTGCLLESKDTTLGRYLEPGDTVTLRVERLGELRSPVVARAS